MELARGARHRRRCLTALILLLERAEAAAEAAADDPAEDAPAVDGCATRGTRLIRRMSVPRRACGMRWVSNVLSYVGVYIKKRRAGRPPDSTRVARVPSPTSDSADPRPRRDRRGAGGGLGRDGPHATMVAMRRDRERSGGGVRGGRRVSVGRAATTSDHTASNAPRAPLRRSISDTDSYRPTLVDAQIAARAIRSRAARPPGRA